VKKLILNPKKCKVSFCSADVHEANWRPVVEVEGTVLRHAVRQDTVREASGEQKGSQCIQGESVLTALSGTNWGWNGNLLRKVYSRSHLEFPKLEEMISLKVMIIEA
jgi:hypothetical protein